MRTIKHESRTPKYLQLKSLILEEIRQGRLRIGDRVPSRAQLMNRYRISDNTCKKALLSLMQDNVLEGHQGKGIFVRRIYAPQDIKKIAFLVWKGKEILNHPAFSQTVKGILNTMSESDTQFFFSFIDPLTESFEEMRNRLSQLNVNAVILAYIPKLPLRLLEPFMKEKIPVVTVGWHPEPVLCSSVVDDLNLAIETVIADLISQGLDRIGYIGSPANGLLLRRINAFENAFARTGRKPDAQWFRTGTEQNAECGKMLMNRLLTESASLPQAVFADDDNICLGALEALREQDIKVPGDIRIVRIGGWLEFLSVSTIKIPFFRMGRNAAALATRLIAEPEQPNTHVMVNCEINYEKSRKDQVQ